MVLDFVIYEEKFLLIGGMFLTYFGLVWGVSYALRTARIH